MRGRIVLMLGVLGALGLAWGLGAFEGLDAQALIALLRDSDPWGPVVLVIGLSVANGLGLPAAPFVFAAIAVWPPLEAFLLLWTGAIGAGVVGYAFARSVGRTWVEPRLPAILRDLDERAARHELRTVILVRATVYLLGPSHWALGLSSVRPGPLLLGSAIGFLPGSALWGFLGAEFLQSMADGSGRGWIALGVIVVVVLLFPRWWARRRDARRRRDQRREAASGPSPEIR